MQQLWRELHLPPGSYLGPVHPLTLREKEMEADRKTKEAWGEPEGREGASDGCGWGRSTACGGARDGRRGVEERTEEKARACQKQCPGTWKIIIIIKWQEPKDKERKINWKQNKQKPEGSQEAWSLASAALLLSSWHRKSSTPLGVRDNEVPSYPPVFYILDKVHLVSSPRQITERLPRSRGHPQNIKPYHSPGERAQIPFSLVIKDKLSLPIRKSVWDSGKW